MHSSAPTPEPEYLVIRTGHHTVAAREMGGGEVSGPALDMGIRLGSIDPRHVHEFDPPPRNNYRRRSTRDLIARLRRPRRKR